MGMDKLSEYHIDAEHLIEDEAQLRSRFPATHEIAIQKSLTSLDKHSKDFISRSPFVCIGTQLRDGRADVSPRGDPAGFVMVLDDRTLAIPDRPGNNRLDSLSNILDNPNVGLLFIIPGFDDTLRINGTARLTIEPSILNRMEVNNRTPGLAIIVSISEVFLHCAKAFRRSHLWDPDHFQNRKEMPSLVKMVLDQTTGAPKQEAELKRMEDELEEEYKDTMY